jgi:hypothetical protein
MTERRAYSRHGLNALKATMKVRGLQVIDHRTGPGRWRNRPRARLTLSFVEVEGGTKSLETSRISRAGSLINTAASYGRGGV